MQADRTPHTGVESLPTRARISSTPTHSNITLLNLQRDAGNTAVAGAVTGSGGAPSATPTTAPPTAGATPMFPVYDRIARAKKMVDATAFEAERAALGRRLRYQMKAIPEDAKTVLKEYPFEEVKEMYAESMDLLGRAAKHYSTGNLLLAGMWAREAGKYVDIEIKAHKIFMSQSMLSYVGKRVGLAVIGIFEGAADSLLGLIDMGAGLVGVHPGLVEWNTERYNTIKGGFTSATGIDHTLVSDDELGRFGGKVAGGLALGGGIAKAAQGGNIAAQFLMFTQVGGGIRSTVDGINVMRGQGKSWAQILSDPMVIAQIAGSIAGVAGIGSATMPALRDFLNQAGLVATAAQLSGMTATLVKIQNDPALTDEQRQQQFLDATANLIVAVGLTADQMYGARQPTATPEPGAPPTTRPATTAAPESVPAPAATAKPATPKPSVHERFDLTDTPDATPATSTSTSTGGGRVGGGRVGSGRVGSGDNDGETGSGDKRVTTKPAPANADADVDLGDTIEPPAPATTTPGDKRTTTKPAPPDTGTDADLGDVIEPPAPATTKPPAGKDVHGRFDLSDTPAPVEYSAASAKVHVANAGQARAVLATAAGEVNAVMDRAAAASAAPSQVVASARRTISRLEQEAALHTQRATEAAEKAAAARASGDYKTERNEARVAEYNAKRAQTAAREATAIALAAQIDGVNPTGSMENCGHVVEAVEARLNGTNPGAQARATGNLYLGSKPNPGGVRHELSIGEQYDGSFDVSTEPKIAANLTARGEGAQGIVVVDWLGPDGRVLDTGHVFNAVYKNGAVYYLDGQTGAVAQSIPGLFPGQRIGTIQYMPIPTR